MDLFLLILYGAVNLVMVLWYLKGKGEFYKFPFWAGLISLGWFYPQAIGGYFNIAQFPPYSYESGMFFAFLCTLSLWGGWLFAYRKPLNLHFWLTMPFNQNRLYYVGAFLCLAGFYFQWKLWSLPEEMLTMGTWSGATVKYHFLGGIFKYGFLILWLLYLNRRKWMSPRFLIFLIPCLLLIADAAILRGRRSEMMNLATYTLFAFWFIKGAVLPRWLLISGLAAGLILINGIGVYRSIMTDQELNLSERIEQAVSADYIANNHSIIQGSGAEFKNYIYRREAYAEDLSFDYGLYHWNRVIFNYVPAQIVGAAVKEALTFPLEDMRKVVQYKYSFSWSTGSTQTGYADAFGSFGWLGAIKFILIGLMMGCLYRYADHGYFLSQVLFLYLLVTAMGGITHGTNEILIRVWIYFFILVFPIMFWAREKS